MFKITVKLVLWQIKPGRSFLRLSSEEHQLVRFRSEQFEVFGEAHSWSPSDVNFVNLNYSFKII